MKLKVIKSGEDFDAIVEIQIDGKTVARGCNMGECPEDANLVRDLDFLNTLHEEFVKVHEAGKKGEPLELQKILTR